MDLADGLRNSLKDHLGWGKPRLACFVSLLLAVLRMKSTPKTGHILR